MKYYRVEFETKMGGYRHRVLDTTANNLSDAKKNAIDLWYNEKHEKAHMFHLRARVLKADEEYLYHWFKEVELE